MSGNSKFDWISRRIHSRWPKWVAALKHLEMIKSFNHSEKMVGIVFQVDDSRAQVIVLDSTIMYRV